MAKCGKEGIMNIAKIYIVGHRENTGVDSDDWYGGGGLLITDMFGRKIKFNFRPSKIKVTGYLSKNVQWTKKSESVY